MPTRDGQPGPPPDEDPSSTDEHLSIASVVSAAASRQPTRNLIFAAPADDPRARRPADAAVLITALIVTVLAGWSHRRPSDVDEWVLELFADGLPGWLSAIATIVFIVGGLFSLGLLISIGAFGRGRGSIARDMLLAGLLSFGLALGASWLASAEWPDVIPELLERDGFPSFPVVRLAFAIAVGRVAMPYLALPMRRVARRVLFGMAVSAVVLTYGSLSAVIGGYALGVVCGATIHLLFGSGVGIPSKDRVAAAFGGIDLDVSSLSYLDDQPIGVSLLAGSTVDGTEALIKVYGRDAADAATAARLWRSTWYRDDTQSVVTTGQQQVEHEALMLLDCERSEVAVPRLLDWGRGEAGDAVIATALLRGDRLHQRPADSIDDDTLDRCWEALARLHRAGVAHRSIDGRRLVLLDGDVILDDMSAAEVSPDSVRRSADVAQMLVTTVLAVGPDRTIAAAQRAVGDEGLTGALELLQRSALSSTLQRDVKDADLDLKELRADVATSLDVDAPELVQLQRVTWGNVIMVALTLFAASALISSLADIGLDTIVDEVSEASWAWLVVAFVLAQSTNIGEWISLTGMVDRPVPFGPTMMFRYAISFISLAVPSEAGAIAMNIRYMQRLGVSAASAVAQGPLLTIVSKGFDVLLLLITSRIIGETVELDDVDSGPVLRLLLLAVILIVLGIVIVLAVPKLRHRVLPPVKEGLSAVRGSITDPERLMRVCGGALMSRLLFAMTLSAAVAAYGGSISFSQAVFVNSAVSLFVGFMPVPGGIGVGEAALTAGLTAVGVPEGAALAAAISHRMVTSYLPPVYGWYTTRWLTQRDYL